MKITFESELMENQKHAVVMDPDQAFEVLQSQDGDALFFSIGTDKVLYLTREVTKTSTGWNRIALSSSLTSRYGSPVAAKTFAVSQNPITSGIDLALVLTAGEADFLYLSLGNDNSDAAWATGVNWTLIPFDGESARNQLNIADVFLMNIPTVDGPVENIFVDILRTPGDPLETLDRYYVAPSGGTKWNKHALSGDIVAGSVSSCLGNRAGDPVPGIYTFGTISQERQLFFTPQYNYFGKDSPPKSARLTIPTGASAIASAMDSSGVTNLFVAGTGGLFLFTPDNQHDLASPIPIVTSTIAAGASTLAAATAGNRTAVWGLDPQGSLFYVMCPAGSEAVPGAWSNPVPLVPSAEGFAFFLNLNAGHNVLFAHVDGRNLIQLTQDSATSDWRQRSILLPATSTGDMAVYKSFTTHIQITDDTGVGAPNAMAAVTAISPVSVYVNDVYYVLSRTVAVNIAADSTGVITVVQETQSLAGVCFTVSLADSPPVAANVNPMSKALARLGTITDGASLGNVQVTNQDGTRQRLVPSSASSDDVEAAANCLVNFVQIASKLPGDGSAQNPTGGPTQPAWGVSFVNGALQYHEGLHAQERVASLASDPPNIKESAGDLFHWFKDAVDDVESFAVQQVDGVYHFYAKIAGEVYEAVLDCVGAVVHAVEFVFNKIKVLFEDLIKWLGFIFEWPDIVRTHKVLKNIVKLYAARAVSELGTLEDSVRNAFTDIQAKVNAWTGVTDQTDTIGVCQSTGASTPSQGSPQSNWALHHVKSNISSAATSYSTPNNASSALDQLINDLETMVDNELDDLKDTINQIKTQVVDPFATLTPSQVIQKLFGIISDLIVKTVENFVLKTIDVLKLIANGLLDLLDATIDIPVLSSVYQQITGDALSFLDLACLVGAVPATVVYKTIAGAAPYPDDTQTQDLIDAPDFDTLKRLLGGGSDNKEHRKLLSAAADSMAPIDVANAVLDIAALFGAAAVVFFATAKLATSLFGAISPQPLRYAAAVSYLVFVAPNFPSAWSTNAFVVVNDIVTLVCIGKTFADNSDTLTAIPVYATYISPCLEALLNALWLIPAIGSIITNNDRKKSDWLSLGSNLAFDLGGILTPLTEPKITGDHRVATAFFLVAQGLSLGYGVLSVGTGSELIAEG